MPSPCHLALFKHHDSKSNWPSLKGPHVFWCWFGNWRAGLTADPLLSHGISCAFLFQIMEKVGSGDKLSHHLPDVYYYVRKKLTIIWHYLYLVWCLDLPVIGKAITHITVCFQDVLVVFIVYQQNAVQSSQQTSCSVLSILSLPLSFEDNAFVRAVCAYLNILLWDLYVCHWFHGHAIPDAVCRDGERERERRTLFIWPHSVQFAVLLIMLWRCDKFTPPSHGAP